MTNHDPWQVDSIQDFWFLRCPECSFDTKEEEHFRVHAIKNHPESLGLFEKTVKEEAIDTSFENEEQNYKITDYFNKIPSDSLFLSSICPEVLIKEEDIEKISDYDGKRYNCFQSDNIFTGITGQKVQVDTVHKGARYNCENCDRKFSQKWQLFVHIKADHRENNSDNSNEKIGQRYDEIKPFSCKWCDKSFFQVNEVKEHIKFHNQIYEKKKTIKSFNCLSCDKNFRKNHLLKIHKESVHEGKKHVCPTCGIACSSKNGVYKHIKQVHENIKRKSIKESMCPICGKNLKISLKTHIEMVHEGKRPFTCSICGLTMATKGNVKMHIQSVHEKIKPNKCSRCESSFFHIGDLKRHIESVHEGKRDFKCSLCEATFSTQRSLNRHVKVVHEKNLPFKCSENDCDKSFGEQHRLKNHVKEVHEGIRKTFLCNHCGKGLCSNQQLKRHEAKFHGGKIHVVHTMTEIDQKTN
jgi:KRAB domain-containing zinc finger protein